MRNISFAMTTPQILARTKTVTRRLGWKDLKRGTLLQAVEKGQGLKKGEKVRRLAVIRVVEVTREPLRWIDQIDVEREGFPHLSPRGFIEMFCHANGCDAYLTVTRIEFDYVDEVQG